MNRKRKMALWFEAFSKQSEEKSLVVKLKSHSDPYSINSATRKICKEDKKCSRCKQLEQFLEC
jgi:hypothetical protein